MVEPKHDGASSAPGEPAPALRPGRQVREIDAFDVSRRGVALAGSVPLAALSRMARGLPEQDGEARWSLQGVTGPHGEALLRLRVQGSPRLTCQRCLEPLTWAVDDEAVLQLVRTEAELEEGDGAAEGALEDEYDKVLGSGRFDVLAQVEDQFILALPYIARHEVCPSGPLDTDADDRPVDERPHPFAGLAALKGQLKK